MAAILQRELEESLEANERDRLLELIDEAELEDLRQAETVLRDVVRVFPEAYGHLPKALMIRLTRLYLLEGELEVLEAILAESEIPLFFVSPAPDQHLNLLDYLTLKGWTLQGLKLEPKLLGTLRLQASLDRYLPDLNHVEKTAKKLANLEAQLRRQPIGDVTPAMIRFDAEERCYLRGLAFDPNPNLERQRATLRLLRQARRWFGLSIEDEIDPLTLAINPNDLTGTPLREITEDLCIFRSATQLKVEILTVSELLRLLDGLTFLPDGYGGIAEAIMRTEAGAPTFKLPYTGRVLEGPLNQYLEARTFFLEPLGVKHLVPSPGYPAHPLDVEVYRPRPIHYLDLLRTDPPQLEVPTAEDRLSFAHLDPSLPFWLRTVPPRIGLAPWATVTFEELARRGFYGLETIALTVSRLIDAGNLRAISFHRLEGLEVVIASQRLQGKRMVALIEAIGYPQVGGQLVSFWAFASLLTELAKEKTGIPYLPALIRFYPYGLAIGASLPTVVEAVLASESGSLIREFLREIRDLRPYRQTILDRHLGLFLEEVEGFSHLNPDWSEVLLWYLTTHHDPEIYAATRAKLEPLTLERYERLLTGLYPPKS